MGKKGSERCKFTSLFQIQSTSKEGEGGVFARTGSTKTT